MSIIKPSDVKQYCYCPRLAYFEYVMPVRPSATYKMTHGTIREEEIIELEKRRKSKRYGLDRAARKFGVRVFSEKLSLNGEADMMLETDAFIYPVDFKYTFGGITQGHIYQLTCYGLLLEENFKKECPAGYVYLLKQNDIEEIAFDEALKNETLEILTKIHIIIEKAEMPSPTDIQERCNECEYRNYCGDIFYAQTGRARTKQAHPV